MALEIKDSNFEELLASNQACSSGLLGNMVWSL